MIENVWAKTYVMSLGLLGGMSPGYFISRRYFIPGPYTCIRIKNFKKIRFDDKIFIPRRAIPFGVVKNILFQRNIEGVVRGLQQPFQFSKIKEKQRMQSKTPKRKIKE